VDQKEIHISTIPAQLASQLLTGCAHLDPSGRCTERDILQIASSGQAFHASAGAAGSCTYVVRVSNGVAWVNALKGTGAIDWTTVAADMIETQAQGLRAVAFQTARRGLKKLMEKRGYKVTGWIMRKELT
jgi:hypothetical protein